MYAIFGATGRTGRVAVETLRSGGHAVRAIVRDAARATDLAAQGAEVVEADLDDPDALDRALVGVDGLYFLVVPPFDAPDPVAAGAARGLRMVEAARRQGVGHVVLLSSVGAQHAAGTGPIVILHRVEQALRASGLPSTFLRAGYFAENWGQVVDTVRSDGVLPSFIADGAPMPTVDTRDIGRTAAELLVEGPAGVRVVELVGPTDPTNTDVAAAFATVLGRDVGVAAYPPAAATPTMESLGLPAPVARMYGDMYEGIAAGRVALEGTPVRGQVPLDDSVQALVGLPV